VRKMSQNVVRGGEKSKVVEKGDGRCCFPCKKCCLRRPVRILIAKATKHCRKYGHIDGGSNEYRSMVISYIFIIFFYFVNFI
jgi:heterodisulfide reductase subunit C